jgi:hypothetical protein
LAAVHEGWVSNVNRFKKLLLFLKLKREVTKMKIDLTQILAAIDSVIAVAETVANLTGTTKDNEIVASIKAFREKFRPIFGADETGGSEDLPQAVADVIDREAGKFEVVADES